MTSICRLLPGLTSPTPPDCFSFPESPLLFSFQGSTDWMKRLPVTALFSHLLFSFQTHRDDEGGLIVSPLKNRRLGQTVCQLRSLQIHCLLSSFFFSDPFKATQRGQVTFNFTFSPVLRILFPYLFSRVCFPSWTVPAIHSAPLHPGYSFHCGSSCGSRPFIFPAVLPDCHPCLPGNLTETPSRDRSDLPPLTNESSLQPRRVDPLKSTCGSVLSIIFFPQPPQHVLLIGKCILTFSPPRRTEHTSFPYEERPPLFFPWQLSAQFFSIFLYYIFPYPFWSSARSAFSSRSYP